MERRLVLLGKTGSGKSAAGNTILRGDYFRVKSTSVPVTSRCDMKEVGHIKVIDTPDMFNPSLNSTQMKREIAQCVELSRPGPHAFLLVIRLGRFTEEEKNAVKWIQENFGEDASHYTIILFTHVDQLEENTLEKSLSESPELRRLIKACGNRYHALDNNDSTAYQVDDLMRKIDDMVTMNGGNYCTFKLHQRTQRRNDIGEIGAIVAVGLAAAVIVFFALAKTSRL